MNKSILMSIKPQYVCEILNGKKTIEIRKRFPKDYVGWVYIYCTKDTKNCLGTTDEGKYDYGIYEYINYPYPPKKVLNGLVVARFWCDKVKLITCGWRYEDCCNHYETNEMNEKELLKYSCLSILSLIDYLGTNGKTISNIVGNAIYISRLKIFDKPRELEEFYQTKRKYWEEKNVQKAPQSWCYIEGD